MESGWEPLTHKLQRDLGLAVGAVVVTVGLVGAGLYALVDSLVHRHRRSASE